MQFRDLMLLAVAAGAAAQTYTSCNPMEKSCSSNAGLASSSYTVDFTKGASSDWKVTAGSVEYDSALGATFTVSKKGDSPTLESKWYIFFGSVSFYLRSAPGTGIVSSAILESDTLDEVDWEWLGGVPGNVQTNYFGKGNTTTYDREINAAVSDGQATFHKYTIEWTSTATKWLIDGNLVRTLAYADAVGGANYPQTPMNIRVGIWAGGDSNNPQGTINWAGGVTDYGAGPFKMHLQKIEVQNYNPGSSYTYGDRSGAFKSIKVDGAVGGVKQEAEAASSVSEQPSTSTKSAESASATTKAAESTSTATKASTTEASTSKTSTKVPTITITTSTHAHSSAETSETVSSEAVSSEVSTSVSEAVSNSAVTSIQTTAAGTSSSATTGGAPNAASTPVPFSGMGTSLLVAVAAFLLM